MKHLVTAALILFLLTIALGRMYARRSLTFLDAEEKARALEVERRGNVWPFVSLAFAVAVFRWMPPAWLPAYFVPGFFAVWVAAPFFISLGAGIGHSMRASRHGLPRPYVRSVRFQTIAFHLTLLLLISAVSYDGYLYFTTHR